MIKKIKTYLILGTILTIILISMMVSMVVGIVSILDNKKDEKIDSPFAIANGNEFSYFTFYESGGDYNRTLGDDGNAFGAYQFDYRYELQTFLEYCYTYDPAKYYMFEPFLSANLPKEVLKGNTSLASAWNKAYSLDQEGFKGLQDKYVLEHSYYPVEAYFKQNGLDVATRPMVIKGFICSLHNRKGYELDKKESFILNSGVTNEDTDESFVNKIATHLSQVGGALVKERYTIDYSKAACGTICEKNMVLKILQGSFNLGNENNAGSSPNNQLDYNEKMQLLFPQGIPGYEQDMSRYLTTITIPIINGNGDKATRRLTVHKVLANDIIKIFEDIQKSGFPIKDVYAYSWRSMAASGSRSHHSYGVAIDINSNENYMIKNGKVIAGSLWSPGINKYSIPANGAVTQAFANRGWIWGGDWTSSKDYMHFSFTGR